MVGYEAVRREEELVRVDERDPVTFASGGFQPEVESRGLPTQSENGIIVRRADRHRAFADEWLENGLPIVGRFVIEKIKAREALILVEPNPLG
jgi:hypothetical protein